MDDGSERRELLGNLINRLPEFEHFAAGSAKRWTLPMAAAWFIWRDLAAVDDQWKIVTGAWAPVFDPPIFILGQHRRQPGTLTCVFQQAGYACGRRPYRRIETIDDLPSPTTTDPYERLRFALQSGRLRATVVEDSDDEGGLTEREWGADDWLSFDTLADPAKDAPFDFLSDAARFVVLVAREEVIEAEAQLSAAEAGRPVWKLEQTLGWIACRRDRPFRSLGHTDLQPPTFFGRSYESNFVEPRPLATLTSALLSGEVHAYAGGTALTRAECISLLADEDGPWRNGDLVFVPDEVKKMWKAKSGTDRQSTSGEEDRALRAAESFFREYPKATHHELEAWLIQKGHDLGTLAKERVWQEARANVGLGKGTPGRPKKDRVTPGELPKTPST